MTSQDMQPTLTHNDYTVGWLCALSKEQTAATAMLDCRHGDVPNPTKDGNTYTLGSVGKHNVVIACLGKGRYGTNPAATMATWLIGTFPSVKFGLLVGIGGGIPPKVRLGDVVVSVPVAQYPGVVQWDFGKAEDGGHFKRIGALNNPPTALLTALGKLETEHEMKGSNILYHLNEMETRWSNMASKYVWSDSLEDPLNVPTSFDHAERRWWAILLWLWKALLETVMLPFGIFAPSRADRQSDRTPSTPCNPSVGGKQNKPHEPHIHHGLIASGNRVIKDANLRDTLNANLDDHLLCIEMEAAGLMNDFPCIVIRGICDYADSHKTKLWQEYAAAVAAAFAKELLLVVPVQEVEVMANLKRAEAQVDEIHQHMKASLLCKERKAIMDWLTPVDYTPQQRGLSRSRQAGTCQWFLESPEFNRWLKHSGETMFCEGFPGVGKTFLTSAVVDYLQKLHPRSQDIGVAFIYCDFAKRDQQRPVDILGSLIKQLIQQHRVPDKLQDFYEENKETPASLHSCHDRDDFLELLQQVIFINYAGVFLVIDALDESHHAPDLIQTILALQKKTGANIFATSRPEQGFKKQFPISLSLEIRANGEDVRKYIRERIVSFDLFSDANQESSGERKKELKAKIEERIIEAVDGIFLLARFHLDSLAEKTTLNHLFNELRALCKGPHAYDHAYGKTIKRIRNQGTDRRDLAKRVLSLLTCAMRPLTTEQLRHALGIVVGSSVLDEDDFPSTNMIVSVCRGLVTVEEKSGVLRFLHYTTLEYMQTNLGCLSSLGDSMSSEGPTIAPAESNSRTRIEIHRFIAMICITYISLNVFDAGPCGTDDKFEERLASYCLYPYASECWGHHTREALASDRGILRFLESDEKATAASQAMMAMKQYQGRPGYSQKYPGGMTGIHLAAYFGLEDAVRKLIERGHNPDLRDGYGRTPLILAADKGHDAVAKVLLETGRVDVNHRDDAGRFWNTWSQQTLDWIFSYYTGRRLLERIAQGNYDEIATFLAKCGYDGNRVNDLIRSLGETHDILGKLEKIYHWQHSSSDLNLENRAARKFDRLIDGQNTSQRGSDDDVCGATALWYAARKGHEATILNILTEQTIEPDRKDLMYGSTPLWIASRNGHERIVKLLLKQKGVSPDCPDSCGRHTPLSAAASKGHESVASSLLAIDGVDSDFIDHLGRTPLMRAAAHGHTAVVEQLLARG
ncbi:uncharacterized protein BKCO1_2500095 [Diplodia corticola]|uniref:Uncharacterized protein n=1 Tax=Diplodia corticola TaxID=236234 RepID=A0A1J9S3A3_9PEZI|nr:uncharacterized protein BKCO1_2500095 [Diplodia corticola]OJD34109.1 hypothetical protein BKCO1_2500095 [Diplodia corticola]